MLPAGWRDRLVPVSNANTRGATGWCLEVHDLLISKAVAGRNKDRDFVREAIRHELVQQSVLDERLARTAIDPVVAELIRRWIAEDFAAR